VKVALGKFFFRYRNALFPAVGALMVIDIWPAVSDMVLDNWPTFSELPLIGGLLTLDVWPIFSDERWRIAGCWVGFILALAGVTVRALTVGLAYIKRGGKNKEVYADSLVQTGMFAHARNPLYFGNILIALGAGLVSNSFLFLVVGLPFFLFAYLAIVRAEEEYLAKKFGAEYAEYCRRVNRFVPSLSGLGATLRSMEFRWQRVVVKEYTLIYETLAGLAVLLIKHDLLHAGYRNSQRQVIALTIAIFVLTVAFVVAWRLKKSKTLTADG
jgi:protein-S-isoprenylcysteine O-methyltransferase Ste14